MPDTTTLVHPKAQVGRRVTFTYYRDLADGPALPGIITGLETAVTGALLARVRLDGTRSILTPPADYEGLTYLDEVVPVPELPMGRFHPTKDDLGFEYDGVLVSEFEEGDMIALSTDAVKAADAINRHDREMAGDLLYDPEYAVTAEDLELRWAYFEWQPEDAEFRWLVHWAEAGDDMAFQLHYLFR